jgi:hypothetical protein
MMMMMTVLVVMMMTMMMMKKLSLEKNHIMVIQDPSQTHIQNSQKKNNKSKA